MGGMRIAKRLARVGLCSRREAERLIAQGRVVVNGTAITSPSTRVTDADALRVDGEVVGPIPPTRTWLFHKPVGCLTSHHDPCADFPTLFSLLPPELPRVVSIGRLDVMSEGLLILTNDGELAGRIERSRLPRTYAVTVGPPALAHALRAVLPRELGCGVHVDGMRYAPIAARWTADAELQLRLTEGKNREIRRLMRHYELRVRRLQRTAFGPHTLSAVPARGQVVEVSPADLERSLDDDGAVQNDDHADRDGDRAPCGDDVVVVDRDEDATARYDDDDLNEARRGAGGPSGLCTTDARGRWRPDCSASAQPDDADGRPGLET